MNVSKAKTKFIFGKRFDLSDGMHTLVWIVVYIVGAYLFGIVAPDFFIDNCSVYTPDACFYQK
jgi:hypothetical protein